MIWANETINSTRMENKTENQNSNDMSINPEKTIKMNLKELLAGCWFLLTLGVSIGGFIKVVSDVKDVSAKIDNISKDVTDLKVQNAKLETLVKGKEVLK